MPDAIYPVLNGLSKRLKDMGDGTHAEVVAAIATETYNSGSLTATYADNPTGVILALPQAMKDVTFGIYPSAGSFALYVTTADDPATTTNWANTDTVFSTASVFSIGLTITGIKVVPQASGASATFRVRG